MEIIEITNENLGLLESIKSNVWSSADKEHYGDDQPNFYKKEFTLAIKESGEIVGYVSVIIDTGVAQIEPLMVKTELKGKGIGSQLIKAAEEKVKALGVHKLWLETGADWKARDFYKKHGYEVRATLPNHIAGREFILMDKML